MATMTIAQALASNAFGIIIADTPVKMVAALSNTALVARVSQFTMNAPGASGAGHAALLAGLGSKFSTNGFRYVVRDTVAFLTDPHNAAGLALATAIAVFDTAANLLAIAGTPLALRAGSVLLSTSATLTLANLITLEAEPSFSVLPGQSITLGDSAANLLALTAAQNRASIKAESVTVNSTVSIATATSLFALPHFSVSGGATLTVSGNLATMTNPSVLSTLSGFAAVAGVAIEVADSLSVLLGAAGAIGTLAHTIPSLAATMTDFETLNAAQVAALSVLPRFSVGTGAALFLSDTVANLLALAPAAAGLATQTTLSQSDGANMAQLAALVALPGFNPGSGHLLTVTDTLAHLAGMTTAESFAAGAVVVQDTVAHLLAAHALPAGTTGVIALLDGNTYTVAQAEALLALAGSLALVPAGAATALLIADTTANLNNAGSAIAALQADGPVSFSSTDGGTITGSTLTAIQAATLVTSAAGLLVADTGSALSAFASQIFGRGFQSITVDSGVFGGTEAQLLDPTLHFAGQSGAAILLLSLPASAQLIGSTVASAAQLTAMSILPGFSLASGATLTVSDTIAALIGAAALVNAFATAAQATDSETVTAAGAATLAAIRTTIGAGHFSLGGHTVAVSDDAANIADPANAAGIALASSVTLSAASIVDAAQAATLIALGSAFSTGGLGIAIADTAANLVALAGSAAILNGWNAQVLLSADATLSVAGAQPLLAFTGFAVGTHHLALADSAADLLSTGSAATEAMANAVALSQAATVTVAEATALLGLHGFSTGGQALTVADTPTHLAAAPLGVQALATSETIVARTSGNAADFTLSAAQLGALQALPSLSMAGFVNSITLADTASTLAALASALGGAASGSLLTHVVPVLSADAVVSAATANILAHVPHFGLAGHTLTVLDSPAGLLSPGVVAGLAIATGSGLAAPAIVTAAIANALAALPGFAANGNPMTVADTPAHLLSLSGAAEALAANAQIVPYTVGNAADFTLTAAQLSVLAAVPHLALFGPITVSDTAPNLILLEAVFAAAAPGSSLLAARPVSVSSLSADATVSAASLSALASLPGLGLAGHILTVRDTPTALLALPRPMLGLATTVALAANAAPWTVSAARADVFASLPSFSSGPGMTVSDNVGNLLAPGNAAGLAIATSVTIGADATVNANQALALHAIPGFTAGTHHLTISNGGAGLAGLDSGTAALAFAIQLSGGSVVTVAQFQVVAALPNFSTNGNTLAVADTASNLLTLAGGSLSLIASTILAAPATLTADQAAALRTLPNISVATGLTVADTAANLLRLAGGALPADWAGELLAGTVALTADASITAAQAALLDQLGARFNNGGHVLTVTDAPNALLASRGLASIAGQIGGFTLAANAGPWTVSAAAATALSAIPHFNAGPGMAVSDGVGNLLASGNAAGLAAAASVTIGADATLNAVQALALHAIPGFTAGTHHLTISNGGAGLATLDSGTAALAFAIQLSGGSVVTVAQFQVVAALPNFSTNGNTLAVADTASNLLTLAGGSLSLIASTILAAPATLTADQAAALRTLPNISVATGLTVADTAANLLRLAGGALPADWAGELLAGTVALTADASITAAQAALLDQLGARFNNGGHVLTVTDAPNALLASRGLASIAGQIGGFTLAANAGPWTVSAAAATALSAIPHFNAGPGMAVSDGVGNLLASGNAAGLAAAASVTIGADATLNAVQALALHAIPGFTAGTHHLTISNGGAGLATLDSGTAALAFAIQLSGGSVVTVAQFRVVAALPNFTTNGNSLVVSDTAANLLGLVGTDTSLASVIVLRANATITADQAEALVTLPHFSTGAAYLGVADTVAGLLHVSGAGPLPDDWAGELTATTIALTADATANAAQAAELAALGGRLVLGSYTLTIRDTAAALLAPANAAGLALAAVVTLSGPEAGLTAAAATHLSGIAGFGTGGNSVTVSDTAANLAFAGHAAGVTLADHVQLGAAATLSAAAAAALIGRTNFQSGALLSIADSLSHLLHLGSTTLAHNDAVLRATPIGLSDDAVATVAQMATLAALPEYAQFSLNGNNLVVLDSGRHLAGFTPARIATPTAYDMAGDATLNAAQANALAALGVNLGDNTLTIVDTPTALLDSANAAGVALAGVLALSGNATVTAPRAVALFGNPLFNTGGHVLTVQDSAAALLGLSTAIDMLATTLALAASETVDVATLLGLTQFGIKFSLAGNTLTVADTAANLATLNTLETHLAPQEVLIASASVTAATAKTLAALPHFSLGSGVTLTIVDSVANLTALSGAAQAIATAETLAFGASVTLTVAQALGLAALPGFSNTGATIVVDDTIAHLAQSGWQPVATGYDVTDSIANLVANASSTLLAHAAAVVLRGDSVTDTTTIDTLAGIPHFSRGAAALVVADAPDAIAAHAATILAVASAARILSSAAISAAQAEQLVSLANAGELTFAGSNHLVVADSFAHLADASNAGGVALASIITVTDTAANLVAATAHDWGSVTPFYALTADASVTGAQATVLAGLGGHYNNGGHALTMADSAAGVIANAAALTALAIEAAVSDTIANIDAAVGGLLALGARLLSVAPTHTSPVSAGAAAGLHALAPVMTGSPVDVTDTASDVVADSANLIALGAHLGAITVTDGSPVAVAVATGLLPLLSHLASGTVIDVNDTGAAIAAQAIGLASLGADLGTVTLSDGTATDAATAAALVPIAAHLGTGVQVTVSDTAAAIDAASVGLAAMEGDGRIAGIVAPNETIAHVLTHGAALVSLNAIATVADTVAHLNAALDALEAIHGVVGTIALTDSGTPEVLVTVAQLVTAGDFVGAIVSPHNVSVSDTAAHIQADIAGGAGHIVASHGSLTSIIVSDSGIVTLTDAQVFATGVDDGALSVLAKLTGGTLVMTDIPLADISEVFSGARGVLPDHMLVRDTAAHIQADLASGASDLVTHRARISNVDVSDLGTITLTEAQVTAAHVDDGAGSVFAKLAGGDLVVTGVTVAEIGTVAALPFAPTSIAVSDTAAHLQADLTAGGSGILANLALISGITANDAGTISLTVSQIEAADVDDGSGSALAMMTGETLAVTGATVADIGAVATLGVPPSAIAIIDTAAHIQSDLRVGGLSFILAYRSSISAIDVSPSGTISLSESQVLHAGVDDGPGSALSLMTGQTLVVTGVAVADIGTVLGLGVAPGHITVSDTAAHMQADLASGSPALVASIGAISAVAVNDAGTVTLSVAQIAAAGVDDGAGSVLTKLSGGTLAVSGASIADIPTLLALGVVPVTIGISDTAAHVVADLISGASEILASIGRIGSIALSDAGTPSLSLTVADLAADSAALGLITTPFTIAIDDTAAHIRDDLASGSSHILAHLAGIGAIGVNDSATISLIQTQVLAAHVDDGAGSVFSKLTGGDLVVTGVTVAEVVTVLTLPFAPTSIAISDTAAHLRADVISGASAVLAHLGSIAGIAVSDSGTISLTGAQILAAGVDDGAGSLMDLLSGGSVVVTDVPVAEIATILGLGVTPSSIAVADSAADIRADLVSGASALVANIAAISGIAVSPSGTIGLTVAQAEAAGVDDGAGSVFGKMTGETLAVTGAAVADIAGLGALTVRPSGLAISDTAANIQADLASGSSLIVANLALIGGIAVSDAGTITLTETQLRAAHVDDGAGSVLSLTSGGTLAVTQVLAADIRTVGGLPVVPDTFAIADTAAHIQADLISGSSAILSYLGAIPSIAISPAGTITLTEAQVRSASVDDGAGSALSKMTGLTLDVTGVPVADIGTILALGVAPGSIAISDTAADIQADLTGGSSAILANLSSIGGIAVTDNGDIAMTVAQIEAVHIDDGAGSVFDKISGGSLTVTGALVADIETLSGLGGRPNVVDVSDTAAHIQADLIAGGSSHILAHPGLIGTITVSDAGTITLTETQIRTSGVDDGLHAALVKTVGGSLAVTHVLAADVGIIAALRVAPTDIAVSDTAAHIQADLASGSSRILANLGLISGIAVSPAGTITLTETQLEAAGVDDGAGSALALMTGQTLTVTHVLAADIGTVAALFISPNHIAVSDTAAHIQADLTSGSSSILANLGAISSIAVSPAGTITLTNARVQAAGVDDGAGSALAKMTGETLIVTGVPVADIATIMALGVAPSHIAVLDSAANIVADLNGGSSVIAADSATIASVTPTDASLPVADAVALYDALLGVALLNEGGLAITGSAAALLAAHGSDSAMLSAAAHVTMDGNPTGLTAAEATTLSGILGGVLALGQTLGVVDTAAHLILAGNAAGIALSTDVELDTGILSDAALVTTLVGLHAFNAAAQSIWIQDTVARLLDSAYAAGIAAASRVMPQADFTVTAAELTALAAIANYETGGHAMTVQDTAAHIAALTQPALGFTSLTRVSDTAAHVSASLDSLQSVVAAHGHALSVVLTDGVSNTIAITVTAPTYTTDAATLDAITIGGVVRVNGTAAQLSSLATTLAGDTVVGEVAVTDTAANILANLTTLNTIGAKFDSATITDATLNAALVSGLLTVPHLHAGSVTISDTGTQIAAAIQASGAPGRAFMNAHTVSLSADSVVTASQALSLQSLTALTKNGHTLAAWDTASHLIDSIDGYLAAVSAAQIDGVYLKTAGGTATVSASTAAALFGIPLFSKNNPNASSNVLTVQDTAAHLESAFTSLNAHKTAIDAIVVSANVTVTDAVYGDLLTLGATAAFGVNVTVRDTAANIVGHAPAQLAGSPSLTPATWALSGSATVAVAGAAFLGGLSRFSPGAFTLTIGADASASVTDANNLGSLGVTLHLGGHHVHVAGSVATVSALSSAAKAIVTPDITDTFAHIATLTIGSGLLGGTIAVTDSEAPSVAQAAAFLSLLLVGGNGGIPGANVSFGGHTEAITDTLANIQTLTGSAGWTANTSVHADFTLVVADTVAHLIDPANTAALTAMAGTTLSANQTVTAASAESLFALETSIHFTPGGHTVTIQDTAAHILEAANADGEALASVWQLSGNDTVAAVDAETLLAQAKFHLNHTLTVSDSSDNLLDGILSSTIAGSAYAASVHVALAGPETLDAQTAAALVALPGFTNNGDLSIQDSSDYLLNAANHTAETDATSVTLVGDETVSASTALHLAALPNFTLGSAHLSLASNDYADAATLTAIGNFDTGFDPNGHTLTMTQNALNLTPAEYTALQSDNVVLNGHALSALATGIVVTSGAGTVHVAGIGVDGATLNVYASDGTSLSQTAGVGASFTANASEGSIGNGVVVTETVGASAATSESAPIIALEATVLTDAATFAGATFAGSGSVRVGAGQYVNVYTTANAPAHPGNPDLVYDATAHTLSLDIDGHAPLVLVTLGAATHPASLDPTAIVVQHFT